MKKTFAAHGRYMLWPFELSELCRLVSLWGFCSSEVNMLFLKVILGRQCPPKELLRCRLPKKLAVITFLRVICPLRQRYFLDWITFELQVLTHG